MWSRGLSIPQTEGHGIGASGLTEPEGIDVDEGVHDEGTCEGRDGEHNVLPAPPLHRRDHGQVEGGVHGAAEQERQREPEVGREPQELDEGVADVGAQGRVVDEAEVGKIRGDVDQGEPHAQQRHGAAID